MSISPRVSILIPNFNNGRESSVSGDRDFLGNLMRSLVDTLEGDATPVEIIIVDDGSSDDSLATARDWAGRTWTQAGRDAHPVCRLIELEHCGVLSVVANRLMEEAQGDICVRLDGDIEVHTPNWASRLVEVFETAPERVGVIGPKQMLPDGTVHAAGDWLFHPRGYHHIARGARAEDVQSSMEVDHVMGCFYCMKRSVWEDVGPYDDSILRGQTIDYTVRARVNGWSVWFIPDIEFTHFHIERDPRKNNADTSSGLDSTVARFEEKWGFDRLAPDLNLIRQRFKGTNVLWNARVFGPHSATGSVGRAPATLEQSRWARYQNDSNLQQQIDNYANIVGRVVGSGPNHTRAVHYGCGDGILAHFLAQAGMDIIGVDADASAIELARDVTGRSQYRTPPRFEVLDSPNELALETNSADLFLLFDQFDRHWNPVGLLTQAHRVLRPGGKLIILTRVRTSPYDHEHGAFFMFTLNDLRSLMDYSGMYKVIPSLVSVQGGVMLMVAENAESKSRTWVVKSRKQEVKPEAISVV